MTWQLPDEVTLLQRIFHDPDDSDDEEDSAIEQPAAERQRAFRLRHFTFIPGEPEVHRAECVRCGAAGPEAGTPDAALAWAVLHLGEQPGHEEFRSTATHPVRAVPTSIP
jgi:hypothetical protein